MIVLRNVLLTISSGTGDPAIDKAVSEILSPLVLLKILIFAAISIVGLIILAVNASAAIKEYSDHQGGGGFTKHIWGAVAGGAMFGISTLVNFLTM